MIVSAQVNGSINPPCRARARVGEWYLWLSGGLEPSTLRVLVSVCRAPTLGTSLATLFSLAKRAHCCFPFTVSMLDTPFRHPFSRAMSSCPRLAIWRTPRTMPATPPQASHFPISLSKPAQSRRSPSLTRSQLGSSPIACQRLLPALLGACHAFCALQAITDSHSQKPAKPSVCRSSQRSTREATMCSKTNFDEPSAWPVGPQENTWHFWAPDTSCVWPAIIEVDGPRYGSSSEACLVSRVRTQSSAPILRSLAWSFAGSELSGTGPLTHMTRSARNHANLLLNLPQYSARLLAPREMPHRTMRYISLNERRDTARTIIGTRLCVASWGSSGQRVCARAPLRLRICSPILPRRGLYQRVSSHALHRPLHRDSLPCPEPRPR